MLSVADDLDAIIDKTHAKKNGTGWKGHCPAHEDTNPSLSISRGDKGGILLKCHAGCEYADVKAALDMPSGAASPDTRPKSPGMNIVATYDYRDAAGVVRYQSVRLEPKDFLQRRPNGRGSWAWNLKNVQPVPYRLPELIAANPREWVFITEGEKDADRLAKLGAVATTNAGGAEKWREEYNEHFRGRRVVILPDNDEAGAMHAAQVTQALTGIAVDVQTVVLPDLPDKGDVSDWLDAGGNLPRLLRLLRAPTEGQPVGEPTSEATPPKAHITKTMPAPNGHSPNGAGGVCNDVTHVTKPTEGGTDIDGAALLADVSAFIHRYVVHPSPHTGVAHTLWIAHAHLMDVWENTPRLAFLSPEPASGKTRGLEVTELLVPNPVHAVNVSPAYLFRKIGTSEPLPTVLFDEVDTVFGPKARDNEDVRGLLNAGHRRGALSGRCVTQGKEIVTVDFPAYCAVALAGLGDLPDTILTRSILVRMRRRAPHEQSEPFRRRTAGPTGQALYDRLAAWADSIRGDLGDDWPDMPDGIEDRDADVWESLIAVADSVGGEWPALARDAAIALVKEAKQTTPSLGIRLLADIRTVFAKNDRQYLPTRELHEALIDLEESPWGELAHGKPMSARYLSKRLSEYGVKSKSIRLSKKEGDVARGYDRKELADVWDRYLPAPGSDGEPHTPSPTSVTPVTTLQTPPGTDTGDWDDGPVGQ